MRQLGYGKLARVAVLLTAAVALTAGIASATATPNSSVFQLRVYNDDPFSTLTTVGSYPGPVVIDDVAFPGSAGFANLHLWKFSTDGATIHEFQNADNFRFCADLLITGNGECEAGINIAPWWWTADGRINVRTTDGEIAAFGGRMPFVSWSNPCCNPGGWSIRYVKGTPIHLEMIYLSNSLTAADPGTVEYRLTYGGNSYNVGPLALDQGNPAEDPPHGLWGILTPATVGGFIQYFIATSAGGNARAEWTNICFESLDPVPVQGTTWGAIKSLY